MVMILYLMLYVSVAIIIFDVLLVRLGFDDIAEYLREQGAFFMSRDDSHQPILGDRKVLFMGLKYVLRQVCTLFPTLQLGKISFCHFDFVIGVLRRVIQNRCNI